jgi:hypothetical protein
MYSAWYLLVLPIAAFVAARQWRGALRLTACIVLGVLVGALFTGTPLLLLASAVEHVHRVFTGPVPRISLVGELQPLREGWPLALVALAILISRRMRTQSNLVLLRSPPLLLALISCALGLHVSRFWDDWGVPALAAWMTTEFDDLLALRMDGASWRRTGFAIIVACVLYMDVTSDSEGRWSDGSTAWDLSPVMDNCPEWLPDPGGILYSYDMRLFYDTFFRYPHGWWRYSLGFEPSMMPEDNLRVYADIMATRCSYASFAPWVRKMTPADRLVLTKHPPRTPAIPQLEWRCFGADLCIGRLPRREGAQAGEIRRVN